MARIWKKRNSCILLRGKWNVTITFENSLKFSWKVKHMSATWPHNSSPRYLPKINERICSCKDLYMKVHSNSFLCHNPNQKKLTCPLTDEWINCTKCCTMNKMYNKYNGVPPNIQRNELLILLTTWMNLKIITLSERRQRTVHTV